MQTVSQAFKDAMKSTHVQSSRLDLYIDGELIQSGLRISDGNIVNDDGDFRTTGDFTLHDEELHPSDVNRLLYPGSELRPYKGICFPDGSEELLPMGVLVISGLNEDDSGDSYNIRVNTRDRAYRVSRAKFKRDRTILAGASYKTIIREMLFSQAPWIEYDDESVTVVGGTNSREVKINQGEDPWALCRKFALTIGCDLYFDRTGICRLTQTPTHLVVEPDWVFADGIDAETMYAATSVDDEETYSRVGVSVETTENQNGILIYAEAVDDNPNSSTYIDGPFGDVPLYIVSSELTTLDQAQVLANAELQKRRGAKLTIQLLNSPNPAIDVFDRIRYVRTKFDTNYILTIVKMTTPMLAIRGQNLTMREANLL
jgi:hypothetical protein